MQQFFWPGAQKLIFCCQVSAQFSSFVLCVNEILCSFVLALKLLNSHGSRASLCLTNTLQNCAESQRAYIHNVLDLSDSFPEVVIVLPSIFAWVWKYFWSSGCCVAQQKDGETNESGRKACEIASELDSHSKHLLSVALADEWQGHTSSVVFYVPLFCLVCIFAESRCSLAAVHVLLICRVTGT